MREMLPLATSATYVERYSRNVIEATRYSFDHLLHYHLASMVALAEQGAIPRPRAARIAAALLDLLAKGADGFAFDPALENLQPNVEAAVIRAVGADGAGDLSLGRARAEFGYVAEMMALRDDALATLDAVAGLGECLTALAATHRETLVPFYTVHMRAEPITLGYYFAAFAENLEQQAARLQAAYERMNLSSAGVGHIVPSPVGIDRRRIAALLGYGRVVRNSLYGYFNVDLPIDVLGCAANVAASVGRLGLDLYQWAGSDLKLIVFGDAWCSGSFIMPQKRNPSFLKPVRRSTVAVGKLHAEALELFQHTPPMQLVDTMGIPALTHRGLSELNYALQLMAEALASITVDRARAAALAGADFVQASQLVDLLMRQAGIGWRPAEQIVGRFVRDALAAGKPIEALDARGLAEVARDHLARTVTIDRDAFRAALDPAAIVANRGDSGPAPDSVTAMAAALQPVFESVRRRVTAERARLIGLWRDLEAAARAL